MSFINKAYKQRSLFEEARIHARLVKMGERHLSGTRRCSVVLTERGNALEKPDVIGWDHRMISYLIECKASLSDLQKDKYKAFRKNPALGMGMRRYYLVPKALSIEIQRRGIKETLPPNWGLLEIRGERVYKILGAFQFVEWNQDAERRLLFSALRDWEMIFRDSNLPSRSWRDKCQILGLAEERLEKTEQKPGLMHLAGEEES